MSLNNSLDKGVKEVQTNSKRLSPGRCPVGEQRRPGRHQGTARKKWTKGNSKFAITCYLEAKEKGQRGYRKGMHQYWIYYYYQFI